MGERELIELLEKATGQDRELDGDIAVYMGLYARRPVVAQPLYYTNNIDAALTLVPEGWEWTVDGGNAAMGDSPSANVWPQQQPFLAEHDMFVVHASAAVALCIAALKARASVASPPTQESER